MDNIASRIRAARRSAALTQTALAKACGVTRTAVSLWETGDTRPKIDKILSLAELFAVDAAWLQFGTGQPPAFKAPSPSNVRGDPISVPPINPRSVVEVLGITRGGENGWFEMNGQVIDRVPLPPGISSANLIFALYVSGESMWPRYEDGDLVYIHRDRPAVNGVDVVVELHPASDGEVGHCLIKRLVKRTATQLVLRQHNPAKDIKIPLPSVARVFRILTSSELMGVR
tara:strand:+ start:1593 stop:2279 length:687 start_codon:yes stop_codon:yes gene_type:complete